MIKLAEIFQDNMILQREKPIPVWGTASPGDSVTVEIQGISSRADADGTGAWTVLLPPLKASEMETMTLTARSDGGEETLTLLNVAVGEVWIAGGQSNMEFWMRYEAHRAEEGQACPHPNLRFLDIPKTCYDGQLEEFDYSRMGVWRVATDADLDYFSATAYYFQKKLAEGLEIPVGIIGCNWGGTISAAWMDADTFTRVGGPWLDWFAQVPEYQDMDAYLAAQHGKPVNDHGNPFGDYFLETVLPRTLSTAEALKFFGTLPDDTAAIFEDYMNHPQPQSIPGSLFGHMVKAIAPFPVRGVLWYQGEGDEEFGIPEHYQTMLEALIVDWRSLWNDDAMPFLIVQIPGFSSWLLDPPGNNLMEIRRCQERVCDTVPGAWLCSGSDAGAETDAHPKDKTAIGHRLALLALDKVYKKSCPSDAPRLSGVAAESPPDGSDGEGLHLVLTFSGAGDGLTIDGDQLSDLVISDGKNIYDFTAAADGGRLVLTLAEPASGTLTLSLAQTSWYCVNLYNSAGIPAIPFEVTVDVPL